MLFLAAYLVIAGFIYGLAFIFGLGLDQFNATREFQTRHALPCSTLRVEFKLADCWLGLFWQMSEPSVLSVFVKTDIWICLLPCLPVHIRQLRYSPKES